jgi:hypothetical protein
VPWRDTLGGRAWLWWCQAAGLVAVACTVTGVFLWFSTASGPVLVPTGTPYGISTPVRQGGMLSYRLDFFIRENCPGDVVTVYRSLGTSPPRLIEQRRPASFVRPAGYTNTPFARELPPEITPGRWQATNYRESHCPTRRVVDQFAFFEFEVIP